jgi:hypothetical protein
LHWFVQHWDAIQHPIPSGKHGVLQIPFPQWLEQHAPSLVQNWPSIAQLAGAQTFPAQLPVQHSLPKKQFEPLPRHPKGPHTPKPLHIIMQHSFGVVHVVPSAWHVPLDDDDELDAAVLELVVLALELALVLEVVLELVLDALLVLEGPLELVLDDVLVLVCPLELVLVDVPLALETLALGFPPPPAAALEPPFDPGPNRALLVPPHPWVKTPVPRTIPPAATRKMKPRDDRPLEGFDMSAHGGYTPS